MAKKEEKGETLDITADLASRLNSWSIVERLVQSGTSRLSAERIVSIHRGGALPGRARSHPQSRR